MKKILAIVFFISTSNLFGQTIELTYQIVNGYNKTGNYLGNKIKTLLQTEPIIQNGSLAKKVINLDSMICYMYENDILINKLEIKSLKKEGKSILIVIKDKNIFDSDDLETFQLIDLDKKNSYYFWYYSSSDETWLFEEVTNSITIIN